MQDFIYSLLSVLIVSYTGYIVFILFKLINNEYSFKRDFKLDLFVPFRSIILFVYFKFQKSYKKLK